MTVTKEMIEAAKAETAEEVLGLLTAHELYQYRPKAFQGFIDYVRKHFAAASLSRSAEAGKPVVKACPCTMIEQDEDCIVGYPSMLCSICGGTGNATEDKIVALAAEMLKIANDVGEPEDPFAAWETIDLLMSRKDPALSTPADSEPVVRAWEVRTEDGGLVGVYPFEPNADLVSVYSQQVTPLYAAPVADGEPGSVPDAGWPRFLNEIETWCCELPDRTSPEDAPEMMLINRYELEMLAEKVRDHCAAAPQPNPSNVDAGDLTERLVNISRGDHERGCMGREYVCSCGYDDTSWKTAEEAADVIKRLTEALKPFAQVEPMDVYETEDEDARGEYVLTQSDFLRARAALAAQGEKQP